MKRANAFLAAIAVCATVSTLYADWGVAKKGMWPTSWPEELEPLREQSRTLTGGLANLTFYEIPFTKREDFESAWPHILKIQSKGVPLTLLRAPHEFLGTLKAGVRIWHPPYQTRNIWLVVDGEIIDFNRIQLPAGTTIIDERFTGTGSR